MELNKIQKRIRKKLNKDEEIFKSLIKAKFLNFLIWKKEKN